MGCGVFDVDGVFIFKIIPVDPKQLMPKGPGGCSSFFEEIFDEGSDANMVLCLQKLTFDTDDEALERPA